jgi:hypothetical protein
MGESRDFPEPDHDDGPPMTCMDCERNEHDADLDHWEYQWSDDHGNPLYKCLPCVQGLTTSEHNDSDDSPINHEEQ